MRRIDGPTAQALGGTEGAVAPFWSPDSSSIGFFVDGTLKKIDATGGPSRTLSDLPSTNGTWSEDNVILFEVPNVGLHRVAASGGAAAPVTKEEGDSKKNHSNPSFLPGGRHFLYRAGARTNTTEGSELRIGSLESGESRTLLPEVSQAMYSQGHLLYARDGQLMAHAFDLGRLELVGDSVTVADQVTTGIAGFSAFSVSTTGVLVYQTGYPASLSHLVWLDRSGKVVGSVGDEGYYGDVSLSVDASQAAVTIGEASQDVWLIDLARSSPTKFTFDKTAETTAIWSPNGSRIVFNSARRGRLDLF